MPLKILRQLVSFSKEQDLPLLLLAGKKSLGDSTVKDVVKECPHRWIGPLNGKMADSASAVPVIGMEGALAQPQCPPIVILKYKFSQLSQLKEAIASLSQGGAARVNVAMEDLCDLEDRHLDAYRDQLLQLAGWLVEQLAAERTVEVDILTDRLLLQEMHNCGAGEKHLTLGPDGHVYACPHFYFSRNEQLDCVEPSDFDYGPFQGSLENLQLKNIALMSYARAPVCQACDAYHCHRCIYLNWRKTLETCVPSRIQCLAANTERNVSRELRQMLVAQGLPEDRFQPIPELKFLDPFEYCEQNQYPTPWAVPEIYVQDRGPSPNLQDNRQAAPAGNKSSGSLQQSLFEIRQHLAEVSQRLDFLEKMLTQSVPQGESKHVQ